MCARAGDNQEVADTEQHVNEKRRNNSNWGSGKVDENVILG